MDAREALADLLDLLSRGEEQLNYERSLVSAGHAPTELVSMFCDDFYHPKDPGFIAAFSDEELRRLGHLYGLLVESSRQDFLTVAEMLKHPKWRRVIDVAAQLRAELT
jgi:hypothetical protein